MHNRARTGGLAMALLAGLGISTGFGAVLSVTSTNDNDSGSLRQVISQAAHGDAVEFAVQGMITLTNGELFITKNLTITGPGATNLFINGNAQSRVFHINSNITASISGLTITNGQAAAGVSNSMVGSWAGTGAPGGGVFNEGSLTLQTCQILGNRAGVGNDVQAVINANGRSGNGGAGGGIENIGTLAAIDCVIANNVAGSGGGAATPASSVSGFGGDGGGIGNAGTLVISNCVVSSNQAGLGLYIFSSGGFGGGLHNQGTVRIYCSTFNGNAGGSAGTVYPGISGTGGSGGFGGGIYSEGFMSVERSTICNNRGGNGGQGGYAPYMWSVYAFGPGGWGGGGAGICNFGALGVTNCTLANNTCGNGGNGVSGYWSVSSGGAGGYGGGIFNGGSVDVVNCTIAWNFVGFQGGSGQWFTDVAYSHDGYGGGIYTETNLVRIINTLIAGNKASIRNTSSANIDSSDLCGAFISLGHNLVGIVTTNGFNVAGDIAGSTNTPLNAQVAQLGDNGGRTLSCALLAESPAIDAGNDAVLSNPWSLTTDQRGQARKSGAHVDIGAYEYQNDEAQFSLTIATNGHGTVTVTPVLSSYSSNTLVTIVATPATNAIFDHWSGWNTNASQTNLILMTTNIVVQANFLDVLPLTVTTPGGGSVQTGSSNNLFVQGTTATLVAVSSNGWQFIGWTGDATGTNVQIAVPMDKAKSVQAVFGTPLSLSAQGDGSVYAVPSLALYPYGISVSLYNAAAPGSGFYGWESDIDIVTNIPATLVVTNATPSVTAVFNALGTGTTWTVTSTNDGDAGSFRQAVQNATDNDTIVFAVSGAITLGGQEILINKSLSIVGPGASVLSIRGSGSARVLEISPAASVTISGLSIANGFASFSGVYFTPVYPAGGILNNGTLRLKECVISGNQTSNGGWDGIQNGTPGGNGGGIGNFGVLELDSCLVANNKTGNGGGGEVWPDGSGGAGSSGGNGGGIYSEGVLLAKNTTITANSSGNGAGGGTYYGGNGGCGAGICSLGLLHLANCTVTGNSTGVGGPRAFFQKPYQHYGLPGIDGYGGGLYVSTNGSDLINTLIAGNSVPEGAGGRDVAGSPTSLGHNLIGALDTNGTILSASGDILGTTNQPVNAMLAALADNGGPTMTCALLPGSPAIDAGDDAVLSAPWSLSTDQRGFARKTGSHVDIGAFEFSNTRDVPLRLGTSLSLPNQTIRLDLSGNLGQHFDILVSPDLAHWTRLATVTNDTGTVSLTQPLNSPNSAQFYRAQQLP